MTPPISKSEFRTVLHCDKIHEQKISTARWLVGIMLLAATCGVGIWSRSSGTSAAAEMRQEIAIGQLQKSDESNSNRFDRMEKSLEKILDLLISRKP